VISSFRVSVGLSETAVDVEFEEDAGDRAGQPGDVPDPDLSRSGGSVGHRSTSALGGACPTAVGNLLMLAQNAVEGGF
jgi:hypothetical protein